MFGYISPDAPYLFKKDETLYKALYCGLCKSIGAGCGQTRDGLADGKFEIAVAFTREVAFRLLYGFTRKRSIYRQQIADAGFVFGVVFYGLCKSIGAGCGQTARTALTYDMAFVSALVHNIRGEDVKIEKARCAGAFEFADYRIFIVGQKYRAVGVFRRFGHFFGRVLQIVYNTPQFTSSRTCPRTPNFAGF